jgi:TusA-related sulfurtransferase
MSRATLDCRGLSCPQPVLKVKEELEKGSPFSVLVDAPIAVENITRFLGHKRVPYAVTESREGSLIEVKG